MNIGRPVHRMQPKMPTGAYKTFAVRAPVSTHFRKATCAEADCLAYRNGWTIPLKGIDPQLEYVARHSHKRFREMEFKGDRYLVFEEGQQCFETHDHLVSLEREPFYFVGRGDWRSFTATKAREHKRPEDFVDDMQTHLDTIRTEIDRG